MCVFYVDDQCFFVEFVNNYNNDKQVHHMEHFIYTFVFYGVVVRTLAYDADPILVRSLD